MYMDFSDRLVAAMQMRGVTSKELAKRSGIPESTISRYRKGAYKPKRDTMNKLAAALRVNPYWFDGTSEDVEICKKTKMGQDLTPFEMRLLNQFQFADENVQKGICYILGIDTKGKKLESKRPNECGKNEINGGLF